uniref:Uncharacterized protein n=1 Tax=Amphimedon queenslandica TaxID=400682 RepID=A0A1X7TAI5_AMPQE
PPISSHAFKMAFIHFSFYVAFLCFISCLACCVGNCSISSCFSRKDEFRECSNTGTVTKEFAYLTFANISSDAWLDSQSLVSLVLSLLCHERQLQWREQQVPPYCAVMNVIGSRNCTKHSCNNCAQFSL